MTALFLDLGIAKSTRIPGVPLDGLPPLEPGGTLRGAFAEALGKAATDSDAEGADAPVEGDGGDDALPDGADPQALATEAGGLPITVAIPATPNTDTAMPGETGKDAATGAASGKTLPGTQPDIAVALPISPKEGDGAATTQQATGAAQPLALLAMRGLTIPAGATGTGQPGGDQAAGASPAGRTAGGAGAATALDPTALATRGEDGSAPGEGKGESKGDGAQRGDAKGEAAGRLAAKLASTTASGKADTDSAQQGFSINVRAADRPVRPMVSRQAYPHPPATPRSSRVPRRGAQRTHRWARRAARPTPCPASPNWPRWSTGSPPRATVRAVAARPSRSRTRNSATSR